MEVRLVYVEGFACPFSDVFFAILFCSFSNLNLEREGGREGEKGKGDVSVTTEGEVLTLFGVT